MNDVSKMRIHILSTKVRLNNLIYLYLISTQVICQPFLDQCSSFTNSYSANMLVEPCQPILTHKLPNKINHLNNHYLLGVQPGAAAGQLPRSRLSLETRAGSTTPRLPSGRVSFSYNQRKQKKNRRGSELRVTYASVNRNTS